MRGWSVIEDVPQPELCEGEVRSAAEYRREHGSGWATIESVAETADLTRLAGQ